MLKKVGRLVEAEAPGLEQGRHDKLFGAQEDT